MADPPYELVWFMDENGTEPCLEWIKEDLTLVKRQAIGYAMQDVLQQQGKDVCKSGWGRDLGAVFEFKLDDEEGGEDILLRIFCHLYGDRKILALHGYDKGENPRSRTGQPHQSRQRRARRRAETGAKWWRRLTSIYDETYKARLAGIYALEDILFLGETNGQRSQPAHAGHPRRG